MSRLTQRLWWTGLVLLTLATAANASSGASNDVSLYRRYAHEAFQGVLAGWNQPSPYPPGALLPMLPMAWAGAANESRVWVAAVTLPLTLAMFALLAASASHSPASRSPASHSPAGGRNHARTLRAAGVVLAATVLLYDWWLRYEPAVALAVLGGLLAARAGRSGRAGQWLAIGFWFKGWPLLLLLPAVRTGGARTVAWAAGMIGAVVLLAALTGGREIWSWVSFNADRPPQPEALATLGPLLLRSQGIGEWSVGFDFDLLAFVVLGPVVETAATLVTAGFMLWAAVISAGYLVCRRGRGGWSLSDVQVATALTTAIILASPVFSPQYLAWLVPVLAVATLDGHLPRETAAVLVACALTSYVHPLDYDALVNGEVRPVLVLVVRDVLLLAVTASTGLALVRSAIATASGWMSEPAPAHR